MLKWKHAETRWEKPKGKLEEGGLVAAVLCPAAQSLEGKVKDMPGDIVDKSKPE